jgi:hypothetical protein
MGSRLQIARSDAALALVLTLVSTAAAAEQTRTTSAERSGLGLLEVEGEGIEKLTFQTNGRENREVTRPGESVWLPPGEYRLAIVELKGGFSFLVWPSTQGPEWFTIGPDRPHRIRVGTPLRPTVTSRRKGTFLELDYELHDSMGRQWVLLHRVVHPRFTVYQGDREIASDDFSLG